MRALPTALLVTLLCTACGGGAGATPAGESPAPRVSRGGLNHITNAEIEAAPPDIQNALQLITQLRPSMLRPRNMTTTDLSGQTASAVAAYVGDVRLNSNMELQNIMRATVLEIRYYSASDATTRWGTGHANGAVLIVLKR